MPRSESGHPPAKVATPPDSCELTATTKPTQPSISRGRVVNAEGCNRSPNTQKVRNEEIRDAYLEAVCVDEVKKLALEVYEEEAGNEADHAAKVSFRS